MRDGETTGRLRHGGQALGRGAALQGPGRGWRRGRRPCQTHVVVPGPMRGRWGLAAGLLGQLLHLHLELSQRAVGGQLLLGLLRGPHGEAIGGSVGPMAQLAQLVGEALDPGLLATWGTFHHQGACEGATPEKQISARSYSARGDRWPRKPGAQRVIAFWEEQQSTRVIMVQ